PARNIDRARLLVQNFNENIIGIIGAIILHTPGKVDLVDHHIAALCARRLPFFTAPAEQRMLLRTARIDFVTGNQAQTCSDQHYQQCIRSKTEHTNYPLKLEACSDGNGPEILEIVATT